MPTISMFYGILIRMFFRDSEKHHVAHIHAEYQGNVAVYAGPMRIKELRPQPEWRISIVADDGRVGIFDVRPYLEYQAFDSLRDPDEFMKVVNGGYFIEWECGADLSADTIEARWQVVEQRAPETAA